MEPLGPHGALGPPEGSHLLAQRLAENIWAEFKGEFIFRPDVFNQSLGQKVTTLWGASPPWGPKAPHSAPTRPLYGSYGRPWSP